MASELRFLIAVACLSSCLVVASPIGNISYIQDITVSYEGVEWVCGGIIKCPVGTYGCRVQRKTNGDDSKKLDVFYACFDEQKHNILSAATTLEMHKARRIDIDLESYIGAESVYSCGYGLGGNENAHGIISPSGWDDLKKSAERTKKTVEDSKAA